MKKYLLLAIGMISMANVHASGGNLVFNTTQDQGFFDSLIYCILNSTCPEKETCLESAHYLLNQFPPNVHQALSVTEKLKELKEETTVSLVPRRWSIEDARRAVKHEREWFLKISNKTEENNNLLIQLQNEMNKSSQNDRLQRILQEIEQKAKKIDNESKKVEENRADLFTTIINLRRGLR